MIEVSFSASSFCTMPFVNFVSASGVWIIPGGQRSLCSQPLQLLVALVMCLAFLAMPAVARTDLLLCILPPPLLSSCSGLLAAAAAAEAAALCELFVNRKFVRSSAQSGVSRLQSVRAVR